MNSRQPNSHARAKTPCVDRSTLESYLDERLDESEEVAIEAHLDTCATCRGLLEAQAAEPSVWTALESGVPDALPRLDLGEAPDESRIREVLELLDATDDPAYLGRVGGYEVCGVIGCGATGMVLKAMEPRLNRFVAIKLMAPRFRHHGGARSRFEREGQAVAAVSNEHVVPIFAVDDHRGLPFIVMQYVAGPSLQERIDRDGPLATKEVTRIGLQVARGLSAAHAQGIIHRDVKPANVLLQANVDRALVTDFGLARVADEASLTRSGTIAGTPQYMSPEQARGDALDPSSDLFSLGSLMYAAATGRPPFRAENVYGVIRRVCESTPRPIRELQPEVEPWLEAFVEKLMKKEPRQRFASASEVAERLEEELAHLQSPTVVPEPPRAWRSSDVASAEAPRRRSLVAWLVGTGLLALGAWGLNETERGRTLRASALGGIHALLGQEPAEPVQTEVADTPRAEQEPSVELPDGVWSLVTEENSGGADSPLHALEEVRGLAVGDAAALDIQLKRGDVHVLPGEAGTVTLRSRRQVRAADETEAAALMAAHTVELSLVDGRLLLADGGAGAVGATYELTVPPSIGIDVSTEAGHVVLADGIGQANVVAGGSARIGRVEGDVDVRTNGGRIDLEPGYAHDAELFAIGGDVRVAGVTGEVSILTSNGDAYLGMSTGSVVAQTSGGDVHVEGIGGLTAAHASVGSVFVKVTKSPLELSLFSATGGDVHLVIDDEVDATLHVRGEIDSNVAFEAEDPGDGRVPYSAARLGEGSDEPIQITTSAGRIDVSVADLGQVAADPAVEDAMVLSSDEETQEGRGPEGGDSLGGSPLGGSGLGGSGRGAGSLGGSGLGGSGLGGSATGGALPPLSTEARARMVGAMSGEGRPGMITTVRFDEPIENIDGYTLYLPRSYGTSEGRLPVLVYLQGAFGVGGEIEDIHHWGLARLVRDETDLSMERNRLLLDGFIIACPHSTGGQYHRAPEATVAILEHLEREYRADPDRVHLTGLSIGGHGCWGLASRLPGRFASIAPMGSRPFAVEDLSTLGSVAIWISHNETDSVVEIAGVREAAQALEELHSVPFRRLTHAEVPESDVLEHRYVFTSSRSGGHDSWTDVYTSEAFYRWLLRQRRSGTGQKRQ
ncbi:MAG: protein kinase [Planctomycetota bacterium]